MTRAQAVLEIFCSQSHRLTMGKSKKKRQKKWHNSALKSPTEKKLERVFMKHYALSICLSLKITWKQGCFTTQSAKVEKGR